MTNVKKEKGLDKSLTDAHERLLERLFRRKAPGLIELLLASSVSRRLQFIKKLVPPESHPEWQEARAALVKILEVEAD